MVPHIPAPDPALRQLFRRALKRTYTKGEIILRPYETPDACYLILTGLVKVYSINQQGEEEIRLLYGPDELFPLPWLIGQPTFNTFYQAQTDCLVMRLPLQQFLVSLQTDAGLSFTVLQQVIEQFAVYAARIDNLEYKYARERLAYRLLLLGKRFGEVPTDGPPGIVLPQLSQQELGTMINLARESVNRELSRFERLEVISHYKGHIVITDWKGLRREISTPDERLYFDLPGTTV